MGCYNITGCISHLPAAGGDEVFAIIGLVNKHNHYGQEFSPGFDFTPMFLPVFGRYNEYGSIECVEEDFNTKFILDFFGYDDIEKLFSDIDDIAVKRYGHEEAMAKIYAVLEDTFPEEKMLDDFEIGFIMDHKFIYEEFSSQRDYSFAIDYDKSYELSKSIGLAPTQPYTDEWFEWESRCDEEFSYKNREKHGLKNYQSVMYLFDWGKYSEYEFAEFWLYPYREHMDILFSEENHNACLDYFYFKQGIAMNGIILRQHNYHGQQYNAKELIKLLKREIKYFEDNKERWEDEDDEE